MTWGIFSFLFRCGFSNSQLGAWLWSPVPPQRSWRPHKSCRTTWPAGKCNAKAMGIKKMAKRKPTRRGTVQDRNDKGKARNYKRNRLPAKRENCITQMLPISGRLGRGEMQRELGWENPEKNSPLCLYRCGSQPASAAQEVLKKKS